MFPFPPWEREALQPSCPLLPYVMAQQKPPLKTVASHFFPSLEVKISVPRFPLSSEVTVFFPLFLVPKIGVLHLFFFFLSPLQTRGGRRFPLSLVNDMDPGTLTFSLTKLESMLLLPLSPDKRWWGRLFPLPPPLPVTKSRRGLFPLGGARVFFSRSRPCLLSLSYRGGPVTLLFFFCRARRTVFPLLRAQGEIPPLFFLLESTGAPFLPLARIGSGTSLFPLLFFSDDGLRHGPVSPLPIVDPFPFFRLSTGR